MFRQHIDICFGIAKRKYDLDIHMLVDDTDDANSRSLEYLALKTHARGVQRLRRGSPRAPMADYNDVYAAKIAGNMVATASTAISVNAHINFVFLVRLRRELKSAALRA